MLRAFLTFDKRRFWYLWKLNFLYLFFFFFFFAQPNARRLKTALRPLRSSIHSLKDKHSNLNTVSCFLWDINLSNLFLFKASLNSQECLVYKIFLWLFIFFIVKHPWHFKSNLWFLVGFEPLSVDGTNELKVVV